MAGKVELYLSEDAGYTWQGPLKSVSGDVGSNISAGAGKKIYWEVLKDREVLEGDKIAFKVRASFSQAYEPEMIFVEGGTFRMGCTGEQGSDCDNDEKPPHAVTVSSFKLSKYEVTQAQWRAVMGNNPSYFSGCDNCPVENVSWNDIQAFISKLNSMTGKTFRLPTEAEWEYAARGGIKSRGYKFSGSNDLGSVAWYTDNSGKKTHPIGEKQPNELGFYDMSGNVWEWCADWYGTYPSYEVRNPKGPESGSFRVLRGGSWNHDASNCRIAYRGNGTPDYRENYFGFRVVLAP
jgi:formylglycine-generating enzyme required for sulfatase activity